MSEISLYRIRLLLGMNDGGKRQKRVALPIMLIVPVFLAGFLVWLDEPHESYKPYENMIYFMYFIVSYTILFTLNRDKNYEIHYLMLPASTKEKIAAHLILAIGIPTIILAVTIPAIVLIQGSINIQAGESLLSYMPVLEVLTLNNFLVALLLQAVTGFVGLAFRKQALKKGFIVTTLLFVLIVVGNMLLEKNDLIEGIMVFLYNGILFCLTVSVWILNYYKLRKREISS